MYKEDLFWFKYPSNVFSDMADHKVGNQKLSENIHVYFIPLFEIWYFMTRAVC